MRKMRPGKTERPKVTQPIDGRIETRTHFVQLTMVF